MRQHFDKGLLVADINPSPHSAAARRRPAREVGPEVLPGVAHLARGDVFRGAGGDDVAAGVATFGAEIDDPVGRFDHFEIVLDDQHRVTGLDQRVQHLEELADIVEVQPGRRLVEDVEGAPGGAPRQFLGELDALRLAAREGRCRLADMDVAEPDLLQGQELVTDRRHGTEEIGALVDGHVEHVGDALTAEQYLQGLAVVAPPLADVALDIDVRQEMHLDLDDAVALAGLAAPALDVEREAAGQIATRLRLGEPGEPVADRGEAARIGRRVRARGAADRRLVDVNDLVAAGVDRREDLPRMAHRRTIGTGI